MDKPEYIYDVDDNPPLRYSALYGLQWAIIMFSFLIISAALGSKALHLDAAGAVRFFQLILLTSGLFTTVQCLVGHRYPLMEGPSTAVLLTFIVLTPYGIEEIQGGTMVGGGLLMAAVLMRRVKNINAWATPNVVGVILMLIAFSLLPFLTRIMSGLDNAGSRNDIHVFMFSLGLVLVMATLSHWLRGFWKTIALLLGMGIGSVFYFLMEGLDFRPLMAARWLSLPPDPIPAVPVFRWPAILAFAASYLAVTVNSLGSLNGIAAVTDSERLPTGVSRGLFFNGAAGVVCGLMGVVGLVSYSISPGVVVANRVASRYVTAFCGLMLVVAALVPKFAALLAMVPSAVVGAALAVAMGAQIGTGLDIISAGGMTSRDYFVVGLPVMLGTVVSILPDALIASVPTQIRAFFGNGLIFGIFLVLLLEHVLMRDRRYKGEANG